MKNNENDKVILDLCGGTGAWSNPYEDAGYTVKIITLPEFNILNTRFGADRVSFCDDDSYWCVRFEKVYGILAAPPCTEFASSGARWWKDKSPNKLQDALKIIAACMDIIITANPVFWCLENPIGRLKNVLGQPAMYFNPCDYGDPYTKKTALWGNFNKPKKHPIEPIEGSKLHKLPPSKNRQELRSITPAGFAQAFFKANK